MKLAKDKLLVYGLTEKEIEDAKNEDGVQKAKMILRSRGRRGRGQARPSSRGITTTPRTSLMTIAPLDHLWVRGSVSELDADKVEVGQNLKVIFPFSDPNASRRQGRLHRQGDRSRDAVRQVPHHDPQSRGPAQGRHVRQGAGRRSRPSRDGPSSPAPPWSRSIATTTSSSGSRGRTNVFERRTIVVGQGEQRHRDRRRARRRPPRAEARRGGRDHRQPDPRADVRGRFMAEGGLLVSQPGQDRLDRFKGKNVVITAGPSKGH